jgi:hypothetical protein
VSRSYAGLSSDFELPSPSYDSSGRKGNRKKERPDVLCLIAVLFFTLLVYSFVRYVDFKLPVPLTVSDVKNSPLRYTITLDFDNCIHVSIYISALLRREQEMI